MVSRIEPPALTRGNSPMTHAASAVASNPAKPARTVRPRVDSNTVKRPPRNGNSTRATSGILGHCRQPRGAPQAPLRALQLRRRGLRELAKAPWGRSVVERADVRIDHRNAVLAAGCHDVGVARGAARLRDVLHAVTL